MVAVPTLVKDNYQLRRSVENDEYKKNTLFLDFCFTFSREFLCPSAVSLLHFDKRGMSANIPLVSGGDAGNTVKSTPGGYYGLFEQKAHTSGPVPWLLNAL